MWAAKHRGFVKHDDRVVRKMPLSGHFRTDTSVREILRSLGLPQDDMNRSELLKLFFADAKLAGC